MSSNLERTHYTVALEEGRVVRRGNKRLRGHDVTIYENYSRLPRDVRDEALSRLFAEMAYDLRTTPGAIEQKLMDNYNAATRKMSDNAYKGDYTPVPVEPIRYTRDPRRKRINMEAALLLVSNN